jgi:hypothetical protein
MAQILTSENSRYLFKPLIRETEEIVRIPPFLGIKHTEYSDNIVLRLKSSDRLDLISFNLYGTSRFDWLLAAYNNLYFPAADLSTMDTLIVPSSTTLYGQIIPNLQLQLETVL